jgi:hypothetical protein
MRGVGEIRLTRPSKSAAKPVTDILYLSSKISGNHNTIFKPLTWALD